MIPSGRRLSAVPPSEECLHGLGLGPDLCAEAHHRRLFGFSSFSYFSFVAVD